MHIPSRYSRLATSISVVFLSALLPIACESDRAVRPDLADLATQYAAAWSSQNPDSLASFYSESGALIVNRGTPSVGHAAIRSTAASFMAAFPDMLVRMDSVVDKGEHVVFHWTWTGTNTGPGGTGRSVRISGYEDWTLDPTGLILQSDGHYDDAEYQRQVNPSSP